MAARVVQEFVFRRHGDKSPGGETVRGRVTNKDDLSELGYQQAYAGGARGRTRLSAAGQRAVVLRYRTPLYRTGETSDEAARAYKEVATVLQKAQEKSPFFGVKMRGDEGKALSAKVMKEKGDEGWHRAFHSGADIGQAENRKQLGKRVFDEIKRMSALIHARDVKREAVLASQSAKRGPQSWTAPRHVIDVSSHGPVMGSLATFLGFGKLINKQPDQLGEDVVLQVQRDGRHFKAYATFRGQRKNVTHLLPHLTV